MTESRKSAGADFTDEGLEAHYYQQAIAALEAARQGKGNTGAGLQVVLFAWMSLEKFINQEYARLAPTIGDDISRVLSDNHKKFHGGKEKVRSSDLTLRGKWRYLPLLLGCNGFDEGTALFQTFAELVVIHDHRLLGIVPGKKSYLAGSKGIHLPLTELLADQALLAGCVDVVPRMIDELSRLTQGQTRKPAWETGQQ